MSTGSSIAVETLTKTSAWSDTYRMEDDFLIHHLRVGELEIYASMPVGCALAKEDVKGAWWRSYLAGTLPSAIAPLGRRLRVADLFCGPGGLANGIKHLGAELGIEVVSELIADQDEHATIVYAANHSTRVRWGQPVQKLLDYSVRRTSRGAQFTYLPEITVESVRAAVEGIDLVLAGPPCQGHSNLNNQTRRNDPRNSLYLTVPAFTIAAGAKMCIIENVPAVVNDHQGVVQTAKELFDSCGYEVVDGFLSAAELGWPQTRRRHFLIARKGKSPIPLEEIASLLADPPRSLWWAIGDLEDTVGEDLMTRTSDLSAENKARIDWLFDNKAYELDLEVRPKSHRQGTTYTAVYGRLHKDRPAPTITTGFMTPGRGRYTHPTRRRVLTPREAARLQGFPDTYRFDPNPAAPPGRALLAKWIGDAVPMPLGYAAALSALGPGLP